MIHKPVNRYKVKFRRKWEGKPTSSYFSTREIAEHFYTGITAISHISEAEFCTLESNIWFAEKTFLRTVRTA